MLRSFRTTAIAITASSFLALLEILRTTMTRILEGSPATFAEVAHRVLPMWITIVLASPWCALMAWRFPFRPGRTVRTVLAHLFGGAMFAAIHLALISLFHFIAATVHLGGGGIVFFPSGPHLLHLYAFYAAMEMSVYAAIVVVLLLIEARQEAAEREVAAARLERSVTAARLESLQSQIRPHFLFNTLNALAVLARRGDGAAVDRAIGDLGELLRASFESPGRHEIRLRDELEFLERYLGLQRIRFPDRLEVEWDVAEEAKLALVPALLIQPLVENALEHGLAATGGGRVRIAARRAGDALTIEVSDDGPGFGAEGAERAGLGLANTRERLALLYGDAGTLICGERPGGGGAVSNRIPWRPAPAGGAP